MKKFYSLCWPWFAGMPIITWEVQLWFAPALRVEFCQIESWLVAKTMTAAYNHDEKEIVNRGLYDSRYLQGIERFNRCEFFEAHETWEQLWTEYHGPARKFYQGLIQAAVALYHYGNGNLRGARKVYLSSCKYLHEYRPFCQGLDLEAFLAQYEHCFTEILASENAIAGLGSVSLEIDPELIPEIRLRPEFGQAALGDPQRGELTEG